MNTPSPEQWISNRRRPDVFPALVELYNGNQVIWWDDISKYEFLRWQPWTNVPPPPKPTREDTTPIKPTLFADARPNKFPVLVKHHTGNYEIWNADWGVATAISWQPWTPPEEPKPKTAFEAWWDELQDAACHTERDRVRRAIEQYIATHPLDGCDVRALRAIAEGGS